MWERHPETGFAPLSGLLSCSQNFCLDEPAASSVLQCHRGAHQLGEVDNLLSSVPQKKQNLEFCEGAHLGLRPTMPPGPERGGSSDVDSTDVKSRDTKVFKSGGGFKVLLLKEAQMCTPGVAPLESSRRSREALQLRPGAQTETQETVEIRGILKGSQGLVSWSWSQINAALGGTTHSKGARKHLLWVWSG